MSRELPAPNPLKRWAAYAAVAAAIIIAILAAWRARQPPGPLPASDTNGWTTNALPPIGDKPAP